MPLSKLQFKPGVNRDTTSYAGEGGFYECDKIRFRSGYPEKLGGWTRYAVFTLLGVCRSMYNWVTSYSDNIMAYGTNKKVYLEVAGNLKDITPIETTTAPGEVTFTATDGSAIITVNDTSYPSEVGNFVTFSGAVSLGGNITANVLNQNYEILTEINANSYTIEARDPLTGLPVLADSADVGDGGLAVVGAYEIAVGFPGGTYGYGWGAGTWGRGAWSSGTTEPINLNQRDWWFDNLDNDLIFNLRKGPIYIWQRGTLANPDTALNTRAVLLSSLVGATDVPDLAYQVIVSQQDRHVLAFGATPFGGGDFDPLLIRWASQDDPINWTPSPTNSAGFIRISRGSRIVRALPTRQEILVFTESHLYTLQYLGTTDVFGIQEYADNVSIISSRSVISANNITYWMGKDKFYTYTGRVETLPTTLRNHVFGNLNYNQTNQIFAGTNEAWNEIWWFYPSADSQQVNRYVVYNHVEQIWYYGTIDRTAWLDTPLREYPQAVVSDFTDFSGFVYNHENGLNDGVVPMVSYIETNDFDLEDGDKIILTRRMIPDVSFDGSTATNPVVDLSIRPRMFPGARQNIDPNDTQNVTRTTIDQYTNQVFIRARGRQLAFRIGSDTLNTQWQLGAVRLDGTPDGRR
jgi:hypothetical protein